ncbi:MAG: beta-lactamase family protein [Lachnospiraceae bacterium]|nr:beta-lactamase family protein [Lachnospiraceae bacterium]
MKDFSVLDRITEEYRSKGYFPSAVISVFDDKNTLYRKAYGENLLPDGTISAVDERTAFDMASCTKICTSTQILLLIDEGKLRLEDRITRILPEIKSRKNLYARLRSVTIYQLLTHTSGILDWYPFYTQKGKDFFDVFESFIGNTEIVDGMEYSDMNYMLLGLVIAKVKGKPLDACLEDLRIALGAGRLAYRMEQGQDRDNMAPSCYGNSIEERMVAQRGLSFEGWRSKDQPVIGCNDGNTHYFFDDVAGLAGISAEADAYERLCRLYLTTESPLLLRSMTEQEPERGLGWQVGENLYPEGCGHTGFSGPWIYVCRKHNFGVVTLVNRLAYPTEHGTNTGDYRRAIAAAVHEMMK